MKILVAPNVMKGTISANDFAEAVEKGIHLANPSFEVQCIPMADGGDGTSDILAHSFEAQKIEIQVFDPLKREVSSSYYLNNSGIAIVEMAKASGMTLLTTKELNPLKTGSWGTGQLIVDAVKRGAQEILLCVGGSATVDAGLGALISMGARCWNQRGELVHGCGADLAHVIGLDVKPVLELLNGIKISIITDVENPLLGKRGAVSVFAPQKGATQQQMKQLKKGMAIFCGLLQQSSGKDVSEQKGMGAAGGITASFTSLLNAEILFGGDFIADKLCLDNAISQSDIVVTGEGKYDAQTDGLKAPYIVAQRAKKQNRHTICICGISEVEKSEYFDELHTLVSEDVELNFAKENAYDLIVQKSLSIFTILSAENKHEQIK